MYPTLFELEVITVIDKYFVRLFIGKAKVYEKVNESAKFVEYKILVCFYLLLMMFLFWLKHSFQLLKTFLEEIVFFRLLSTLHDLSFTLSDLLGVNHFDLHDFIDHFPPHFDILPNAMISQHRR